VEVGEVLLQLIKVGSQNASHQCGDASKYLGEKFNVFHSAHCGLANNESTFDDLRLVRADSTLNRGKQIRVEFHEALRVLLVNTVDHDQCLKKDAQLLLNVEAQCGADYALVEDHDQARDHGFVLRLTSLLDNFFYVLSAIDGD
jgi:hypothetical protein